MEAGDVMAPHEVQMEVEMMLHGSVGPETGDVSQQQEEEEAVELEEFLAAQRAKVGGGWQEEHLAAQRVRAQRRREKDRREQERRERRRERALGGGGDEARRKRLHLEEDDDNPFSVASVVSFYLFLWLSPLVAKGAEKPLELDDIPYMPTAMRCATLKKRVRSFWNAEKRRGEENPQHSPSFFKAVSFALLPHCLVSQSFIIVYALLSLLQPFVVGSLIRFLVDQQHDEDDDDNDKSDSGSDGTYFLGIKSGYLLAIFLWSIGQVGSVFINGAFTHIYLFSISMRSTIMTMIFDKTLRLSANSRAKYDTGSILTMMSVDTERIWQGVVISSWLWLSPLLILCAMILLALEIGWSSVAGIGTMVFITWLQERAGSAVGRQRRALVTLTDQRAMRTNEVVQGIRIVKFYDWARPLFDIVQGVRNQEIEHLWRLLTLKALSGSMLFVAPVIVSFVTFVSYWGFGNRLSAELVYKVMAFLNLVRLPIAIFPQAVSAAWEAKVAVSRISDFMNQGEVDLSRYWITSGTKEEEEELEESRSPAPSVQNGGSSSSSNNNSSHESRRDLLRSGSSASAAQTADEVADESMVFHYGREPRAESARNLLANVADREAGIALAIRDGCFAWDERTDESEESAAGKAATAVQEKGTGSDSGKNGDGEYRNNKDNSNGDDEEHNNDYHQSQDFVDGVRCSLLGIDVSISKGSLVAVVGHVGQGKTSLLSAILGEMRCIRGAVCRHGRIGYVSQQPWIQNATLRHNIAFHSGAFNQKRYDRVMDVCQLTHDATMLPDGDETEIGERGINLSGGQRARVSLARAVYLGLSRDPSVRCDVFLLDDPLAAVDAHVGRAIFDDVVCGVLRDKTRVLVMSSAYHFLPRCDSIIVMLNGRVVMQGTFEHLVSQAEELERLGLHSILHSNEEADEARELLERRSNSSGSSMAGDLLPAGDIVGLKPTPIAERGRSGSASQSIVLEHYTPGGGGRRVGGGAGGGGGGGGGQGISTEPSKGKLTTTEDRERGEVSVQTYVQYFRCSVDHVLGTKHCQAWCVFGGILGLFFLGQGVRMVADYWPGLWATRNDRFERRKEDAEEADDDAALDEVNKPSQQHIVNVYLILVVVTVILGVVRNLAYAVSAVAASQRLHSNLLELLLRAKVSYFDVTPSGRILNRFSKDLDHVDTLLPEFLLIVLINGIYSFGIVVMCLFTSPWFVLLMVPISVIFVRVGNHFRKSSREVKRLEGVSRSPVFSSFGEALSGPSTIRAFGMERRLSQRHMRLVDDNGTMFFSFHMLSRWLALRMDLVSNFIVLSVGLLVVGLADNGVGLDISVVGLALVYSLQLTSLLQFTIRSCIETENNMTAVERLLEFAKVPQEPPAESPPDAKPSADWPTRGAVVLENVRLRYRPGLPLVLKGLSLNIRGGEKIGVVGRTGAGKSSLMQCLFRLVEPEEGSAITLDGVDILKIGLSDLRSRLTIIPQDPTLFSGTLRSNLDPFGDHDDEALWSALERAHLKAEIVAKFPLLLDHNVAEKGDNLSVGQRQLLCVARALLRNSRVLIMDEATASVDTDTDRKIQLSLRENFSSCTVLCIAHRLETIIDYDRVAVMDDGRVAEFDSPERLLLAGLAGGEDADDDDNDDDDGDIEGEEEKGDHATREARNITQQTKKRKKKKKKKKKKRGLFLSLVQELGPGAVDRMRVLIQQGLYGSWESVSVSSSRHDATAAMFPPPTAGEGAMVSAESTTALALPSRRSGAEEL